jgi:hypothetical protein
MMADGSWRLAFLSYSETKKAATPALRLKYPRAEGDFQRAVLWSGILYAGAFLLLLLRRRLGSGCTSAAHPLILVIIARLLDEEKFYRRT